MRFNYQEDLIENVTFDFTNKTLTINGYIKPVHIVIASIMYNYANWDVNFDEEFEQYAEIMNYKNPFEIDTIDGAYHSKAIKLREHGLNLSQIQKIIQIIKNVSNFNDSSLSSIETILTEIFDNFYDHAEANYPPICCVQEWRTSDFLEISIADTGIGIPHSLYHILFTQFPNENPCKVACLPEISSKKEQNHGGFGLYYTKEFIKENNGKMHLISGKFCYIIDGEKEEELENHSYQWNGTIIRLIINKNKEVNAEKFFNEMPPFLKEEEDDWLF